MPRQTKSIVPEISASFITSLERKVAHSMVMSEARRLGVLLDQLLILHHHVLHVGEPELLGDAQLLASAHPAAVDRTSAADATSAFSRM